MKFLKYKIKPIFIMLTLAGVLVYSSCSNDDDDVSSAVQLDSFGPTVFRLGELKFVGSNLNNVTAIVLPDNIEIPASAFKTKTSTLIVIDVPEEVVEGRVVLKTPEGDITTKTDLSIAEPITITSITPAKALPGEEITIAGTYLNLIEKVIFSNGKAVTSFESQSKTSLVLVVPLDAQTGILMMEDGEVIPNVIKSEADFQVTLPVITSIAPNPIKAGSNLTITGTNLDLVEDVTFEGGIRIQAADFVGTSTATEIVVKVPVNAKDGKIKLRPLSQVEVESAALTLVAPAVSGITPTPAKNSGTITVTGTNLDLVNTVTFGGNKTGTIQSGGTATQIIVSVPADAVDGKVKFGTQSDKWDSTQTISLVVPTITSFTAASVQTSTQPSITINGSNLDIVASVKFGGDWESKDITVNSASQIVVKVKPGSVSGKFTMITTNGTQILSATDLTIVPDMPAVTSINPTSFALGQVITISAPSGMDIAFNVVFPGNVTAVTYTSKTSTTLKVTVPFGAKAGKIKLVNYANEIYEIPIDVKVVGTEAIVDPALMINSFDETGHDLTWDNWGSNVELGNNPAQALTGRYLHGINASAAGWTWIWGCNHGELPKPSVTKADHVLKMDIKITKPIPAGANFQIELGGTRIDLGNLGGTTLGSDWATITYDLSTFGGLPAVIPSGGEWGINLATGTVDMTGVYIDNIRFQAK